MAGEKTRGGGKAWEDLPFSDNFMFGKVMTDPALRRDLISTVLQQKVGRVEYVNRQETMEGAPDSKGIRLDVYMCDGNGTVYNVEMQARDEGNLPKRSRYYQGMIDLSLLERGASYKALGNSMVIFLCTFDPFGRGAWRYTFGERCSEEPGLLLGDGTRRIFVNAKGDRSKLGSGLEAFLNYLSDGTVSADPLVERLETAVSEARRNREWRRQYMIWEAVIQDERDKGTEEGRNAMILALLRDGKYSEGEIAGLAHVDTGYVVSLREKHAGDAGEGGMG